MNDSFAYMAFIVIVVMLGQAILWSWVGFRAQQIVPWWPIKLGDTTQPSMTTPLVKPDHPATTSSTQPTAPVAKPMTTEPLEEKSTG
ncbi:MAG: hypothetical protein HC893_12310 [Chloroflexaceae bacterium]|nr:hypothetical protein [Chloroflexaceae bacterium]NJL34491.1 hypothetical protein [Chloroflexaceae bacterium]NJO04262.1 hypothetical protein [Chloroflexaceae bacterium]